MKKLFFIFLSGFIFISAFGQLPMDPSKNQFRQMGTEFATPNAYRTASGAPGQLYWQQQVNYKIGITLDDENHRISGVEQIQYINHSPDELRYLWVQLDQNIRQQGNLTSQASASTVSDLMGLDMSGTFWNSFDGGFNIEALNDREGRPLPYTINYTMMRVDLPEALVSGDSTTLQISWRYKINDRMKDGGGRSGMEYFEEEDNYIYTIAQFFPRMAVYNEVEGWQNKQYIGVGEFALPFGNYEVDITVPADHVVGATGELQNPAEVLSAKEMERLEQARSTYDKPVIIVSQEEAEKAERCKAKETRTWKYKAENVRDFAFASSRKFIWDGMAVRFGERSVLATSLYSKEGNPLWGKYATRAVAHTLQVYSRHTFDYPYPVACAVHTDHLGMEYPMICFNGGRPEEDGTYSERIKWKMLFLIIHEVGHNYFPMIVNSDERQWYWMDEGLNTFLQGIAQREWDHNHPNPGGRPSNIVNYMKGDQSNIAPIMSNAEIIMQKYPNAYEKPAVGLSILRETIMGRELFDFAFREYAQRWKFKHPTPEDLFRTLEDASGVDLDWFWRGWFYGTDPVDISLDRVTQYRLFSGDWEVKNKFEMLEKKSIPEEIAVQRNRAFMKSMVEKDSAMRDFYDDYEGPKYDKEVVKTHGNSLSEQEKSQLARGGMYYQLDFSNVGGMVMPLVIEFIFDDGSTEIKRVPAEIWSKNNLKTSKVFWFGKKVVVVNLDPNLETADCDMSNNHWPPRTQQSRFEIYKRNQQRAQSNPMQKEKR